MTTATSVTQRPLLRVILNDFLDKEDVVRLLRGLSDRTTGNKDVAIQRLLKNRFFRPEQLLPLLKPRHLAALCRQRGKDPVGDRPTLEARLKEVFGEEAKLHHGSKPAWWELIHPSVRKVAESRFASHHFADAVLAASTEVTVRVRYRVWDRTTEELDGFKLMTRAFSGDDPVIQVADLGDQSGRDEQQGYMHIFAGTVLAIRNPKAHDVLEIGEGRAIHHLFLTSLLMHKLDDAGVP